MEKGLTKLDETPSAEPAIRGTQIRAHIPATDPVTIAQRRGIGFLSHRSVHLRCTPLPPAILSKRAKVILVRPPVLPPPSPPRRRSRRRQRQFDRHRGQLARPSPRWQSVGDWHG